MRSAIWLRLPLGGAPASDDTAQLDLAEKMKREGTSQAVALRLITKGDEAYKTRLHDKLAKWRKERDLDLL